MAKGSDAANVLASEAEVTVNFRILPGESVAGGDRACEESCVKAMMLPSMWYRNVSLQAFLLKTLEVSGLSRKRWQKYIPQLSLPLILRSGVPIPTNIRR